MPTQPTAQPVAQPSSPNKKLIYALIIFIIFCVAAGTYFFIQRSRPDTSSIEYIEPLDAEQDYTRFDSPEE